MADEEVKAVLGWVRAGRSGWKRAEQVRRSLVCVWYCAAWCRCIGSRRDCNDLNSQEEAHEVYLCDR